jgi:uncharacterized protein
MIRYAIERGVNYLDLGNADINQGSKRQSLLENVNRALKDGYRQQVKCALTIPARQIKSINDCDLMIQQTLKWLPEDRIDFLILGDLDQQNWSRLEGLGILPRMEKVKSDGYIGRFGFFFHDDFQSLRTILNSYDGWTLCQFRYSLMDIDHHPGIGGLQLAVDHGLAVIVSQPLLNERLIKNIPDSVIPVWTNAGGAWMAGEWGLRWVWNHPQVSTIIVNMKSMTHVMETESIADRYSANNLSINEEINISRVRDAYWRLRPVPCTTCHSCTPCPMDIDIPRIFELWNEAIIYNDSSIPKGQYYQEEHQIEKCTGCGTCTDKCGMKIAIPEKLKEAQQILTAVTNLPE